MRNTNWERIIAYSAALLIVGWLVIIVFKLFAKQEEPVIYTPPVQEVAPVEVQSPVVEPIEYEGKG